jgi:hypothetical protein
LLVPHFPPSPELAIAIAKRVGQLLFELGKTPDLLPHVRELAFEHGLYFWTGVMLLSQGQQLPDFSKREPQLLSMPDEFEVADLLSIEEAVPTRAAVCRLRQPESLIEADCVDADFR